MSKTRHSRWRTTAVIALLWSISGLATAQAPTEFPATQIVWSELTADGAQVRFSQRNGETWSPAEGISSGKHMDVAPCIVVNDSGQRWVVWTRMETLYRSWMMLSHYDGTQWQPAQRIDTDATANTGGILLLTKTPSQSSRLWLVWSGFDGEDDEVFYSILADSGRWADPARVIPNNAYPDIQPLAGLTKDGQPWVMWFGYDGDQYRQRSVSWESGQFGEPTLVDSDDERLDHISDISESLPVWPVEISKPKSACMTQPSKRIPALPLRFADKNFVVIE